MLRVPDKIRIMAVTRFENAGATGGRCDLNDYLAVVGELHRVADEIYENLPQPRDVTDQNLRDCIFDEIGQVELLLGGLGREQIEGFFDAGV